MKKFFVLMTFLIFSVLSVQAKNIRVQALQDFSTKNPSSTFLIRTVQDEFLPDETFLPADALIYAAVLRVEGPKRGKRNGYIKLVPEKFVYSGKTVDIKNSNLFAIITYYRPIDTKDLAFNVARKTANIMFHGVVSAIQFVQGVVENEEDNRIKSGVMNVYRDSFLTYIEVGKELNVRRGDILILKIKKIH